jgi:hypothetical protein
LHVVVPIAVTPPGASVHESALTAEEELWPMAKHSGTAPTVVPSKRVPAYVKEYVDSAVVSAAVVVAGVHAAQPVKEEVTVPAEQLVKKPDKERPDVEAAAWTVKVIAVYEMDDVAAGTQKAMKLAEEFGAAASQVPGIMENERLPALREEAAAE